ncbi:MAG: cell division protein FtsL [Azoarcus sp.]|jgi:cell division protein FtsL|nr:cell division protein FtsL [Azoarcus sp.]
MIRFDAFLAALLIVLAAASALGVVASQHETRKLHDAFEREQNRAQSLDVEWGRLQIEQGSLVDHRRVEEIAREKLDMAPPQLGQILVLEDRP